MDKNKQPESIRSEKFQKLSEHEIQNTSVLFGGGHTHRCGPSHNMTSTWIGFDSDWEYTTDPSCDTDPYGQ
jgi:hypothetical protein